MAARSDYLRGGSSRVSHRTGLCFDGLFLFFMFFFGSAIGRTWRGAEDEFHGAGSG